MRQGNGGVLHNSVQKKHSISTYDTNRQTRLMRRFFCKVSTIRRYERNTFSNPKWLLFGTKSGPYLQLFVSIRLQSFSDRASSAKKCLDPMRTTHTQTPPYKPPPLEPPGGRPCGGGGTRHTLQDCRDVSLPVAAAAAI